MRKVVLRELDERWDIPQLQRVWNSVVLHPASDPLYAHGEPTGLEPRAIYVSTTDETNYCNLLVGMPRYRVDGALPPEDDYPRFNGVPLKRVPGWPVGTLGFLCEVQ